MKKFKIFILMCVLWLPMNIKAVDQQSIKTKSEHMVIVNMDDDFVLYDKQMNDVLPSNSLTRLITIATVLKHQGAYKEQEDKTFDELLQLSLTEDEALLELVNNLGGEAQFIVWMNEKATQLGLLKTNFVNVLGIDDEAQVTTLQEYMQLIKEELKSDDFYQLLTRENNSFILESQKQEIDTQYLLGGSSLEGNSVSIHQNNGLTLLCISVQSDKKSNVVDNFAAVSYYFKNYEYAKVIEVDEEIAVIPVRWGSNEKQLNFVAQQDYYALLPINYNKEDIVKEVVGATIIEAPLVAKQYVGEFKVSYSNEVVLTIPLFSNMDIEQSVVHYNYDQALAWMSEHTLIALGGSTLTLIGILLLIKNHRKKQTK